MATVDYAKVPTIRLKVNLIIIIALVGGGV